LPISAIQSTPIYTTPQSLKRKASFDDPSSHIPETLEDASRIAAEEDKRRRNTAASARFRVKKKQKEQQLEKTAKEMTDRVSQLEQENQQLKVENKWLKNLLVEKNEVKNGQEKNLPLSPSIHTSISKDGKGAIAD
jgi:regulator of replication initiation timing